MSARRGIFGWMLFDWANQPFHTLVVTFLFAPWFVSRVAADPVAGQEIWGWTAAAAGGAVALAAPWLGAAADRGGRRKAWTAAFSIPFVIGCAGLWTAAPGMADPRPVLAFYALAYFGSEFTLVFTNAMLPEIGPRSETGRISGSGWALGYVGGVVSLVLVLGLFAPGPSGGATLLGLPPLFDADGAARATGPLSALWFAVFALPFFLWTPDAPRGAPLGAALRLGWGDLGATLRDLRRHRGLFTYLVASMVYRDALAALFAFGGVYAAGVLGWGVTELGAFGVLAAAAGALGAWAGGRADKALGPRPVAIASIWALTAVAAAALATSRESALFFPVAPGSRLPDLVFLAAGAGLGAAGGALQAASRTLLAHLAEGRMAMGQAFGLYALSGRATAFLGPAAIALVTGATGSQRLGAAPVIVLLLVGLALLYRVRRDGEQDEGQA